MPDVVIGILEHVRNLGDAAQQNSPGGGSVTTGRPREQAAHFLAIIWIRIHESRQMDQLAVEREDVRGVGAAKLQSGSRDRIEDRLHIRLRSTDHAKDLARRRLLLERLR